MGVGGIVGQCKVCRNIYTVVWKYVGIKATVCVSMYLYLESLTHGWQGAVNGQFKTSSASCL